jgi:hypothetical protein
MTMGTVDAPKIPDIPIGIHTTGTPRETDSMGAIEVPDSTFSVAALRSSTVSMGFGYMRRWCTSNAKRSSATSLGRERDRPVCFSIRRKRWRTVFGWQISI